MANRFAIANGNFNDTATWSTTSTGSGGASVPVAGDNAIANNRTVTITANATCDNVTNGNTYGGTAGGGFNINDGVTLTANVIGGSVSASKCVTYNGTTSASINGDVTGGTGNFAPPSMTVGVYHNGTGTLTVTGAAHAGGTGQYAAAFATNSTGVLTISGNINLAAGSANGRTIMHGNGTINITGNITGATSSTSRTISGTSAVDFNAILNITGNVTAGSSTPALSVGSSGILTCVGNFTATNATAAIESTTATATLKLSGSFISAADGTLPVYARKFIMNSAPLLAFTRYSLDGSGDYVDMFTADNSLGQANPSDVRSGVSYASGNLTGSLTVPVRGTVSYGVEYGPSMPFTATRSGTTATATMAYSYPYQVGDFISVTGASNAEWNGDYTIATVVSGTEITFDVPSTHSTAAGTGALAQTKGTATLNASDVATAVWSAATRTITGGTVDTLVNAPSVPSASAIADEVRLELAPELSNLDAPVSGATAPTASTVATAVRSELSVELSNLDAPVSGATAPDAASVASAVRTELSSELAKVSALNTDRLAQCSTVATTGAQIAAALS